MKRKEFFTAAGAATVGAIGGFGFGRAVTSTSPASSTGSSPIMTLGGKTLEEHRQKYRADLFDRFLPYMDDTVIDHELGGFMCAVNIETGERESDDKRAWYEGRGMWVYSFLYNNVEADPRYLEIARKSKDFILPLEPDNGAFYATSFSRTGEPLTGPGDIYGNLFVAEGLAEYAKASGEMEYYDKATEMILYCFDRYEDSSYVFRDNMGLSDTRVVGHWMIFLRLITQMLRYRDNADLEQIADRAIEAILELHMDPEYNLHNEYRRHDYSKPDGEYHDYCNTGHSIETFWMLMDEAARRRDASLFEAAKDGFQRHMAVAKDRVYDGYFFELRDVNDYDWTVRKVLWEHEEILIGTLLIAEHTGDTWAKETFADLDEYVRKTFTRPGYRFWASGGNRRLTELNMVRAEHYHHPRHLMLNLLAIERLIERNGEPTGIFG